MGCRFIVSFPVFLCFYMFCISPASFALLFRQGFDKNLTPQTGCGFRSFGNSFVAYMVL